MNCDMLIANIGNGERSTATPGGRAVCPECRNLVIAKCGKLISWHWAHVGGLDCDKWAEPMTKWHKDWQELFPFDSREVVMRDDECCHRADVVAADGTVIELQHSTISVEDIAARETFYKNMIWVFDARQPFLDDRLYFWISGGWVKFRWKHARKSIDRCSAVLLDIGDDILFHLVDTTDTGMKRGRGFFMAKETLVKASHTKIGVHEYLNSMQGDRYKGPLKDWTKENERRMKRVHRDWEENA